MYVVCMQNVDYLNLNVLIFNLEAQDGGWGREVYKPQTSTETNAMLI